MSMMGALVPQLLFLGYHTLHYYLQFSFCFLLLFLRVYYNCVISPFLFFPSLLPAYHSALFQICALFFLFVLLYHIFTCICISEYKPLSLYNTTCVYVLKAARPYGKQKVCFSRESFLLLSSFLNCQHSTLYGVESLQAHTSTLAWLLTSLLSLCSANVQAVMLVRLYECSF